MGNILLVEPDYRSKFPPLGLMKISSYHKRKGDCVTFVRGRNATLRDLPWHRIYVSSLFTWELPRTVSTAKYYANAVPRPADLYVGGIGATLLPDYVRDQQVCTVLEGPLDRPNMLGKHKTPISDYTPDYDILDSVAYPYEPKDAYFCRATHGCKRHCRFCAVPRLEPEFKSCVPIATQVNAIAQRFGEKQGLVLLDNNILASDVFEPTIAAISALGFAKGCKRNGKQRTVDFNQGIDCRLITSSVAKDLSSICLDPVRLAFDQRREEKQYRKAICLLAKAGFIEFTNYMLYNYGDSPQDLYERMRVNIELSEKLGIRVTGFPMRFIPMDSVRRDHVSDGWTWRYLRGMQCVLHATRGLVSPNPPFFARAFGHDVREFLGILAMPDRYIMYRSHYEDGEAKDYLLLFNQLSESSRSEFLHLLDRLHQAKDKAAEIREAGKYRQLLEHHYPKGQCAPHGVGC